MTPVVRTIATSGGRTAIELETPPTSDGAALVGALGLPPPQGTLIVNGSTSPDELGGARLGEAVSAMGALALADHLTVVTGATDAGIFALLGQELADASAPLIGVAPLGLVTWADRRAGRDQEQLEGHHTHFVLVEGSEWGDETGTMMALAEALGRSAPTAAILCGGGAVSRREVLGHVEAGRPIVVLAGSGRLADDLAAATAATAAATDLDPSLTEVVEHGRLVVCSLSDGPDALIAALRQVLAPPRR